ncbi:MULTISPECIES: stage III sporulation protein SpoIIIAB [unclassified Paenibacillus]|uniref:stage III sporulation protein SpoIIIAB n=1 Tax=unclassified Paenibacillus TaxID=185978 RepID=UPI001C11D02E|nr:MULTISPECIES: stage III sporulation protein SpoIIIAB [unclassified Paenibacillus]MBU5443035.1 stage III sporulation protein AB [Paenibacillus sp. MSJ-34]CAH0118592.1 Stage III sporulation protein AB [Paenibacillus sp. CECT 9249]
MTLKLIGAALVILSCSLFGFYQAAQFANRPKQVRQLVAALQRLETEIWYGHAPLPDALRKIGEQIPEPLKLIFTTAAQRLTDAKGLSTQESWQQAIEEHWKSTAMKQNEKNILHQFGFSLGTSDRNDQIKHIRLAVGQLQHEETAAFDEQARYEKMSRSLGLLAGALIVILMF